jgi:large subunit ribosomal protein L30
MVIENETFIRLVRVEQIRSNIGIKPKAKGTLRALGLRDLGQSNVLPDVESTWGMLNRVVELVRIHCYDAEIDVSKYFTERVEGTRFSLHESGEITVEAGNNYNSITWPTDGDPKFVLGILRKILSIRETSTLLVFFDREERTLRRFEELEKLTRSELNDLQVARIDDLFGARAIWQRAITESNFREAGMASTRITKAEVISGLQSTGTSEVRKLAKDLATAALLELR